MWGKTAGIKYVPQEKKHPQENTNNDQFPQPAQKVQKMEPTKETEKMAEHNNNNTPATTERKEERKEIKYQRLDLKDMFPGKRDSFAIVVDNLFSEQECKELIERSERQGYDEAKVGKDQVRVSEQRNNWRCIIDDEELADKLFQRVKDYVPPEWLGSKAIGLNERLRFLKYHPGEYFKPHNDGIYVRSDNTACSYVTIHLYLSDVPVGEGGETTFTTEQMTYGRHLKNNNNNNNRRDRDRDGEEIKRLSVRPVTGRVLIFEHHLPHEVIGSTLLKGEKYTVRTDVMYDLNGKQPYRGPRWGLKFPYPHPQYKLNPVPL